MMDQHIAQYIGFLMILVHRAGGRIEIENMGEMTNHAMVLQYTIENGKAIVTTQLIKRVALPPVSLN